MTEPILKAPFPYFGGKSRVASEVWERIGNVPNYIEPFFGSGAMLLGRPTEPGTETVNDKDGFVANFWRAMRNDPELTADFSNNPVFENDLHAAQLEGDPEWFDAKTAGWWAWGMCCWIGSGFCSGQGPWIVTNGKLENRSGSESGGVKRVRPALGGVGRGVNRKRPALGGGNAGRGVNRQLVYLRGGGQGVNMKEVNPGSGINRKRQRLTGFSEVGVNASDNLLDWFNALSERLRRVRVCCGDWSRICGPSVTAGQGLTGVFLDPPYNSDAGRDENLYRCESNSVSHEVREWAIEQGKNPLMRIALCGYEGEHKMPDDWECFAWNAASGYASQNKEKNDNGTK